MSPSAETPSVPAPSTTAVEAAIAAHRDRPGALLPLLHQIQESLGYVPPDAVPVIARALNLSRAEVHGVVSFYHDFREQPAGKLVVKACRAESCQAAGGEAVIARLKARLGVDWHGTTADGAITLEPVYCLGNCALSPAITVGSEIHGRVDVARVDAILDQRIGR